MLEKHDTGAEPRRTTSETLTLWLLLFLTVGNSLSTVRRNQPEPRKTQSIALRANTAQWQVLPPLPVPQGTPG